MGIHLLFTHYQSGATPDSTKVQSIKGGGGGGAVAKLRAFD